MIVFCQHCRTDAAQLGPTCPSSKNGRHSTMSRWGRKTGQLGLFAAVNEKAPVLVETTPGMHQGDTP